jgi:hypothetical protein
MRLGLGILLSVSAVMVATDAAAYCKQIRKFATQLMKVPKHRYPMLSSELAGDIEESFRDEIKFMKLADSDSFKNLYLAALKTITDDNIGTFFRNSGFGARSMEPNVEKGDDDKIFKRVKKRIARVQRLNFALSLVRTRWHEHVAEHVADPAPNNQDKSSLVRLVRIILENIEGYTASANLFEWTHVFDKKGVFGVGETLLLLESVALFHERKESYQNMIKKLKRNQISEYKMDNWHALVVAVAQTPLSKLMKWNFDVDIKKIIDFTEKEIKDNVLLSQTGKDGLFNICS